MEFIFIICMGAVLWTAWDMNRPRELWQEYTLIAGFCAVVIGGITAVISRSLGWTVGLTLVSFCASFINMCLFGVGAGVQHE